MHFLDKSELPFDGNMRQVVVTTFGLLTDGIMFLFRVEILVNFDQDLQGKHPLNPLTPFATYVHCSDKTKGGIDNRQNAQTKLYFLHNYFKPPNLAGVSLSLQFMIHGFPLVFLRQKVIVLKMVVNFIISSRNMKLFRLFIC